MKAKVCQIIQQLTKIDKAIEYLDTITRDKFVKTENGRGLIMYMKFDLDSTFKFFVKEAIKPQETFDLIETANTLKRANENLQFQSYGAAPVVIKKLEKEIEELTVKYYPQLAFHSDESETLEVYKQGTIFSKLKTELEKKKEACTENLNRLTGDGNGLEALKHKSTSEALRKKWKSMDA